jgi:hypothetical protein
MRSILDGLPGYWQDKTIIALSLFLAASPWLLGYSDHSIAQWNAVIIAAIMASGATVMSVSLPYWPDFIVAFMAFWLFLAPRILDFTSHLLPTLAAASVGCAVVVLALWSAIRRSNELRTMRESGSVVRSTRPTSTPAPAEKRIA